MKLFPHQIDVLKQTEDKNRVAYYLDMGLGKTFVGSEKMMQLNKRVNLVICQKSKVNDWVEHFIKYYGGTSRIYNLTNKNSLELFFNEVNNLFIAPLKSFDFSNLFPGLGIFQLLL